MVTGKIKFFDNKVNNFGYISVDGEKYDVKILKEDVPVELRKIFHNGEGYPVEFDIQDFNEGNRSRKKAVNFKLITKFGIVISLRELVSQDNINYRIKKIDTSNKGKVVEFLIKEEDVNILRKVNSDEIPEDVVRAFCDNDDYKIVEIFINQYLSIASDVCATEYILNKIKTLNTQEISELFSLIYTDYDHFFLISDGLRWKLKELSLAKYAQFIEKNLWSVDEDTQDRLWSEFVDIIYSSNDSSVIFELLQFYLRHVDTQGAINFIVEKIVVLEQSKIKDFLDKSFQYNSGAFLESQSLHGYLRDYNFSQYLKIVQQILESDNQALHQSIIRDLIHFLSSCSEEKQSDAWRNIAYLEDSLEYHGYLWDIAPLGYKQKVIREKYAEFFALVKEFDNSSYPYSRYISDNCGSYAYFNASDNKLIEEWMPEYVADDKVNLEKARLISARGAEKLVKYFYEQNGKNVEDISVHQVTKKSQDWIKGDIRVNSSLLLDVKNARKSTNSDVYSEFCIPEFKQKRGKDVLIAAVFSPYNFFDKEGDLRLKGDAPKYLGELEYNKLISLINIFSDDSFEIDLSRGFDPNNYLPPWLFDYNNEFYLNQIQLVQKLKKCDVPSYQDLKLLDGNLIYKYANIFIFGNYQLPESWIIKMPKWAVEFYKSLHRPDNLRLSLPYLYLSILKHFLKMLPVLQTEYHPQLYKVLLGNDLSLPCKIYDPLQIIDSFCETLETLWKNRDIGKLKEFKVFKFTGQGLLQGKQSKSSSSYTTILAYCGGWTDAKGKCGHTPLVIGKHRVCEGCGYLICPEDDCQFCKRNCSHYEKRKEARQRRRRY